MQIVLPGIHGSGELWLDIVKTICADTSGKYMIDLGCHKAPYTPLLGFKYRQYVDIQERPLDHESEQKYFFKFDVVDYVKRMPKSDATIIASDVIEHLTKEEGMTFYEMIWFKAKEFVIFTPYGDCMINIGNPDSPDTHRSGWLPEDLEGSYSIVFPDFHPTLGIGAFFAFNNDEGNGEQILNSIKQKYERQSRIS